MGYQKIFSSLIVAILSPVVLFCVLVSIAAITLPLYRQAFAVINEPHIAVADPEARADAALAFVMYQEPLQKNLFTATEQLHLTDIKKLITNFVLFYILILTALLTSVVYLWRLDIHLFYRLVTLSFAGAVFFGLIAGLLIFVKFETLFELFHRAAFYNGNWQFSPMTESLIVVFPPLLFYTTSYFVIGTFILLSTLLAAFFHVRYKRM